MSFNLRPGPQGRREWVVVLSPMETGPVTGSVSQVQLFAALMENVRYTATECQMTASQVLQVLGEFVEPKEKQP